MKKILIGYIMDGKHSGIDKYLLNFIKTIYSPNVQIDILTNKIDEELENILKEYNTKLIEIPSLKHPIKQYKKMNNIINKGKYDITYFNISETFNCMGILAAKRNKIRKIIIHSHAGGSDEHNLCKRLIKKSLNSFFRNIIYKWGNVYLTCSDRAGLWLYPKKVLNSPNYKMIYNAIDFKKFKFNEAQRNETRKMLNIKDELILGHVGNFCYQKNQDFLIEIAKELKIYNINFKMFLIGVGDDFNKIKEKVHLYNLEDNVKMLGVRQDVDKLLQAMDIYLLPSYFEGLPISGIEAQIAGLKCIFSTKITNEVCITSNAMMLDIKKPSEWVEGILQMYKDINRVKINLNDKVKNYSLEYQKQQFFDILQ